MALALGMTVEELGERMSSRELTEWLAFDRISPIGDERDDLRAGIVASTVANCHRSRREPFTPQDFMPFVQKPEMAPAVAIDRLRKRLKGGKP